MLKPFTEESTVVKTGLRATDPTSAPFAKYHAFKIEFVVASWSYYCVFYTSQIGTVHT